MEKRLKNTQSKSDNDITDEEAGRARVELARQSSLRRQDSARSLARANNDMKHRLAQVREWPAAEHAPLLASFAVYTRATAPQWRLFSNLAVHALLHPGSPPTHLHPPLASAPRLRLASAQVKSKTDVDITDEETGRFRVEYAAAAKKRREEEAARIRAENATLRDRVKAVQARTDDGDGLIGGGTPLSARPLSPGRELANLTPMARGSEMAQTTYLRLKEIEENQNRHARHKKEHNEHIQQISANASEWAARGHERSAEGKARREATRLARTSCKTAKQDIGRSIRLAEEHWQKLREQEKRRFQEEMRERVILASGLDARLDAAEAAQDKSEQEEGTRMRLSLAAALLEKNATWLKERKKRVAAARTETATALQLAAEQPSKEAAKVAEAKKSASAGWMSARKQANEDEYLAKARANRLAAQETRAAAKASAEQVLLERKRDASKERGNDHLVTEAKARILEEKRREAAEIYKNRFATRRAAAKWEASPLSKLFMSGGGSRAGSTLGTPRTPRTPRRTPRGTVRM